MKNSERSTARLNRTPLWKKASLALLTSTLILSGSGAHMMSAFAEPLLVSQRQQGWNCVLNTARLINEDKMVLQLDVLDKPETTYANAVYQVFVRQVSVG
jgi:pyruvate-formate lyase-activating enzyme